MDTAIGVESSVERPGDANGAPLQMWRFDFLYPLIFFCVRCCVFGAFGFESQVKIEH